MTKQEAIDHMVSVGFDEIRAIAQIDMFLAGVRDERLHDSVIDVTPIEEYFWVDIGDGNRVATKQTYMSETKYLLNGYELDGKDNCHDIDSSIIEKIKEPKGK